MTMVEPEVDVPLALMGIGVSLFLTVGGLFSLILPGHLRSRAAQPVGLGRPVGALLLLSFAGTYLAGGYGNIPVFINEGGVLGISFFGALLPLILGTYFLVRAGWFRGLLALPGIALVAAISYFVTVPMSEVGIVSWFPLSILPAIAAGLLGILLSRGTLAGLPVAYAIGSVGAFIGAR